MIAFLHTAEAHVATFEALLREVDASVPCRHRVDDGLLAAARQAGTVTDAIAQRVVGAVVDLAAGGASVVVCTCSTIGAAAERAPMPNGAAVLRIDRPMAERAVARGGRIAVIAALATTLAPTVALLRDAARWAERDVELVEILCADAWPLFERGDGAGYLDRVAAAIAAAVERADVVVLAQASMAAAAGRAAGRVPVLSSPRLGVEAAVRLHRTAEGR